MYYMRYGNYSWWNPNEFRLLRPRSANASLDKYGGHYIGWHFFQVSVPRTAFCISWADPLRALAVSSAATVVHS